MKLFSPILMGDLGAWDRKDRKRKANKLGR